MQGGDECSSSSVVGWWCDLDPRARPADGEEEVVEVTDKRLGPRESLLGSGAGGGRARVSILVLSTESSQVRRSQSQPGAVGLLAVWSRDGRGIELRRGVRSRGRAPRASRRRARPLRWRRRRRCRPPRRWRRRRGPALGWGGRGAVPRGPTVKEKEGTGAGARRGGQCALFGGTMRREGEARRWCGCCTRFGGGAPGEGCSRRRVSKFKVSEPQRRRGRQ